MSDTMDVRRDKYWRVMLLALYTAHPVRMSLNELQDKIDNAGFVLSLYGVRVSCESLVDEGLIVVESTMDEINVSLTREGEASAKEYLL